MSSGALDVRAVCLTCTVDTRNKSPIPVFSSGFQFQGNEWRLYYGYGEEHVLGLEKNAYVPAPPFDVSVQLECGGGTGRIGTALPQVTRFTNQFKRYAVQHIWAKEEGDVLRSVPEFRQHATLKFIVVLKLGGGTDHLNPPADSVATQTDCSIPEGVEVSCLESLSEDFSRLMVHGSDPDVEFRCAGQSIKAHGTVVCARSRVLAAMLGSDMVEGRTRTVDIPDMELVVFQYFLKYIYTGKLPEPLTFEIALALYEIGDQYAVLCLARRCSRYLLENLSVQNACDLLATADAHSDGDIVEKVIAYMLEAKVPQASDRWASFSDDHPKLANRVLKRGWDEFLE